MGKILVLGPAAEDASAVAEWPQNSLAKSSEGKHSKKSFLCQAVLSSVPLKQRLEDFAPGRVVCTGHKIRWSAACSCGRERVTVDTSAAYAGPGKLRCGAGRFDLGESARRRKAGSSR